MAELSSSKASNKLFNLLNSLSYEEGLTKVKENTNLQLKLKTEIFGDNIDLYSHISPKELYDIYYDTNIYIDTNVHLGEAFKTAIDNAAKIDEKMPGVLAESAFDRVGDEAVGNALDAVGNAAEAMGKKKKTKTKKAKKHLKHLKKGRKSKKIYKGGSRYFETGFNTLTVLTLTHNDGRIAAKIYGSSLPYNSNIKPLYDFFKIKGINTMISFQNCDNTIDNTHIYCCKKYGWQKPTSLKAQEVWEENGTGLYINNEIKDMTSGSLENFKILYKCPVWKNPTLIHCYAGYGRTGSALLYYWFRFETFIKKNGGYAALKKPFLGLSSSSLMYDTLLQGFRSCIRIHNDPTSQTWSKITNGSHFNTTYLINEVFKCSSLFSKNLFITRINYILLYTAFFLALPHYKNQPENYPGCFMDSMGDEDIYLYPKHITDSDIIFRPPILTNIRTFVENNVFGIKKINIPNVVE